MNYAFIKKTKRKTYIHFSGSCFRTNGNWNDLELEEIGLSEISKDPQYNLGSDEGWENIGEFESAQKAYETYVQRCKELSRNKTEARENQLYEIEKKFAGMKVIPATGGNIRDLLFLLNSMNWGRWKLPKLSIGYSAHQFRCGGQFISTIKLDSPISDLAWGIENESKFKSGGSRRCLPGYKIIRQ